MVESEYPPVIVSTYQGLVMLFHDISGLDKTIEKLQDLSDSAKAGELGEAPYMWGMQTPLDPEKAKNSRKWFDEYTDFLKGRLKDG